MSARAHTSEFRLPSAISSQSQVRRNFGLDRILRVLLVSLAVTGTLLILDDSRSGPETATGSGPGQFSITAPQRSTALPVAATLNADRATVQTFRDSLQRELDSLNSQLPASHSQPATKVRRYLIQKLLSNHGGSGLNDRLGEIDQAMNLSTWPGGDQQAHQEFIDRAIRDIHDTAVSCRSGALARAGQRLGLPAVQ